MRYQMLEKVHRQGRVAAVVLALVLAVGAQFAVALPASAAASSNRLYAGETLTQGQRLTSPNGMFSFVMQADGNLVLTAPGDEVRWNTATHGHPGAYAVMQYDGNLVVMSAEGVPLWHASADKSGAEFVQIQDDGNAVLYAPGPTGVWYTNTTYYPNKAAAGSVLVAGDRLQSPNGQYEAVVQPDGNVVLYGPSGWTWRSATNGSGATKLAVQADGNLVLYTADGAWVWQSYTHGQAGGWLEMQNDGNLVLYNAASQWTWQTYTYPGYVPPAPPEPPAPAAPAPQPAIGAIVVDYAAQQIGKPYAWGASGPGAFDCSGLTSRAWAAVGVTIPRVSREQYARLNRVPYGQAQPGDIVAYGNPTVYHVAIYAGAGQMIEAPNAGKTVRLTSVRSLNRMPYVLRPAG